MVANFAAICSRRCLSAASEIGMVGTLRELAGAAEPLPRVGAGVDMGDTGGMPCGGLVPAARGLGGSVGGVNRAPCGGVKLTLPSDGGTGGAETDILSASREICTVVSRLGL